MQKQGKERADQRNTQTDIHRCASCRDIQVVDRMQRYSKRKHTGYAGKHYRFIPLSDGDAGPLNQSAYDVQNPCRSASYQNELRTDEAVRRNVAGVFKYGKADAQNDTEHDRITSLRRNDQQIEQERKKTHALFDDRRGTADALDKTHAAAIHREAIDVGAEKADAHTRKKCGTKGAHSPAEQRK